MDTFVSWRTQGDPKNMKNGPQKLLIIGPDSFISQSSPDHSPQPRIDFSYYEISGPDICSLICVKKHGIINTIFPRIVSALE